MNMKTGCILLVLCCTKGATITAQGYDYLFQYFESDSLMRPGYSEIKIKTTQASIIKNWDHVKTDFLDSFYDESGRPTEEEQTSSISTVTIRTRFGYDSLSGRLNHILRTGDKINHEAFAQYDTLGRLSEIADCDEGKPCRMRFYFYDEDGTERLYAPARTIEFQFGKDRPGSVLGISAADKQKDELLRERFFDPEGNLNEIRLYQKGAFTTGWTYEYDPFGRKTRVWVYKTGRKEMANEYKYDENGQLTEETMYWWAVGSNLVQVAENQPRTIHYTYDKAGRLSGTEQSGQNFSKIREFTYFEN